jgi:hypothetical protein
MESSYTTANDIAASTDHGATLRVMKENIQPKKIGVKKKQNPAKKKIERKKILTPVSSPAFNYVPSTAEKRREAKIARNQQFLKSKGLDLSISELNKMYNNKNKRRKETYYVEKIVNHRKNKYITGEYEVEVKWTDYGTESNTWEDMREKILEVPQTFLEYYKSVSVHFKTDFENYLKLYPDLKKLLNQTMLNSTPTILNSTPVSEIYPNNECCTYDNNKLPETVTNNECCTYANNKLPETVTNNECCSYDHNKLKNYKTETNPRFCKKGFYLNGKMCSGKCMGLFDDTNKGVVEGQMWIKPSVKAPVWVCQGLVNKTNCHQALCSDCAKVMMSNGLLM